MKTKLVDGSFVPDVPLEWYFELVENKTLRQVMGYIDYERGIAYTNYDSNGEIIPFWRATDLNSGMHIVTDSNFDNLYTRINELATRLEHTKLSKKYIDMSLQFRLLLEEYSKNNPERQSKLSVERKSDGNIILQMLISSEEELKQVLSQLEN